MANIKFSQFTQKTTLGTVDFLVGYTGAQNVQIDPADLLSDYSQGTGAAGQVTFFSAASTVTGDNDLYWDNTTKRLGIGTTSPSSKLHVAADIRTDNSILFTGTGFINSNATNLELETVSNKDIILKPQGTGNVGISTTTPSAKLDVQGTLIATGVSQLGTTGANVLLTSSSAGNVGIGDSGPTAKLVVNNVGTKMLELKRNGNIKFRALADSNHAQLDMFNSSLTKNISLHSNSDSYFNGGNVGIGTTSPGVPLDVFGADGIRVATNSGALAAGYFARLHSDYGSNALRLKSRAGDVFRATDFGQAVSILTGSTSSGTSERIRITSTGNVGIGTSSPGTELQVNGTITADTHFTSSDSNATISTSGTGGIVRLRPNGISSTTGQVVILDSGNVGIGTDSPNALGFLERVLNVSAGSSSSTTLQQAGLVISGSSDSNDADDFGYLSFANHQASSLSSDRAAEIRVSKSGTDVDTGKMAFYTANGANLVQAVEIAANQVVKFTSDVETTGATSGFILKSPNGTRYRIQVDNSGNLSASAV